MAQYDYDLVTIGAGSGGVAASRRAGSYGARVAIVESRRIGGTCVMRGCVPKKLMVYAAQVRAQIEDAAGFGWAIDGARLDFAALQRAKAAELDRLEGVYRRLLADAGVTVIEGRASIVDPHAIVVDGRRVTAERILVATGGRPRIPDVPGAALGISSDEALDLDRVPPRVTIVGSGYIAVEFAGIFAGAGACVNLLIRGDEVLRGFDDDVRRTVTRQLAVAGIRIAPRTTIERLQAHGDAIAVCGGGAQTEAELVLWAVGRVPNREGLGLEAIGVALDDQGAIAVDAWSQTSVSGIYAIGDCTSRPALTPVAIADGRALADTLWGGRPRPVDHDAIPTAVFGQPPIGTVGLTEAQARKTVAGTIDVYRTEFRAMKHTLTGRDEKTMMKLVVHRQTDRVLGLHMVGADAPEIVQGFAVALRAGATKAQFDATVGIHPTAAEEFVTMRTPLPQ